MIRSFRPAKLNPSKARPSISPRRRPSAKDIEKLFSQPHAGYDHNFVLDNGGKLALAARVVEPKSGRVMEVLTDQPGVQLYTANFLSDTRCTGGKVFGKFGAFCLETQHYPGFRESPKFSLRHSPSRRGISHHNDLPLWRQVGTVRLRPPRAAQ